MGDDIRDIRHFYETLYHYEEDVVSIDMPRIRRYYRRFDVPSEGRLLDIGCGAGLNVKYWEQKGFRLFGIDLSHRALKLANSVVPEAAFSVADGQNLPFDNDTFDIITALGVIEHFPNPKKGFEETYRILKPGGKACLVVPNSFGKLGKVLGFKGTEQEQELLLTMNEWIELIESTGFKVTRTLRDRGPKILKNLKPFKVIARLLLRSTLLLPKRYAYVFVFHAEK